MVNKWTKRLFLSLNYRMTDLYVFVYLSYLCAMSKIRIVNIVIAFSLFRLNKLHDFHNRSDYEIRSNIYFSTWFCPLSVNGNDIIKWSVFVASTRHCFYGSRGKQHFEKSFCRRYRLLAFSNEVLVESIYIANAACVYVCVCSYFKINGLRIVFIVCLTWHEVVLHGYS